MSSNKNFEVNTTEISNTQERFAQYFSRSEVNIPIIPFNGLPDDIAIERSLTSPTLPIINMKNVSTSSPNTPRISTRKAWYSWFTEGISKISTRKSKRVNNRIPKGLWK